MRLNILKWLSISANNEMDVLKVMCPGCFKSVRSLKGKRNKSLFLVIILEQVE